MRGERLLAFVWFLLAAGTGAAEATAPIPLDDLFANPTFAAPRLSPDGKQIAVLISQGDVQVAATRAISGGPVALHGKLSDPEARFSWLAWAKPDVLWISSSVESSPRSFFRFRALNVHAVSLTNGSVHRLGMAPRILHWLPDDPTHVLIDWGGRVVRMHAFEGTRDEEPVQDRQRRISRWHADAAGRVRVGEALRDGRYSLWARVDAGQKLERVAEWPLFDDEGPRFLEFHPDPTKLYVAHAHQGRMAIFTLHIPSRSLDLVYAHPEIDVSALIEDPVTRKVLAAKLVLDGPELHFLDEAEEQEDAARAAALGQELGAKVFAEVVSRDRAGRMEIVEASSDTQPPVFFLRDRKLGTLFELFENNDAIPRERLSVTRRASYAARDGLEIPAYLTLPAGGEAKQLPLIVMPHGGPSARDEIEWNPAVQMFASRGFAVLRMNFRGSAGYGESFRAAGHREWGGKMQDDITDGVHWLTREGIADADRVGIYGISYGGFAALAGLAKTPELYRAGAAYAPVTDLPMMLRDAAWRVSREVLREEIGGGWGDRKTLRDASPVRRAAAIRVPVLLGHGENDLTVPVKHSQRMALALRKAGKRVEYLEFPHEIHGFILEANRVKWHEHLIAFFEQNLAPRAKAESSGTVAR